MSYQGGNNPGGNYPPGNFLPGNYLPGNYPPGAYPPPNFPPGNHVPGPYPQQAHPHGAYPAGPSHQGQYNQGPSHQGAHHGQDLDQGLRDNSYPINHPENNPPGSNYNEGTPPGGAYRTGNVWINSRGHSIYPGHPSPPNRYGRPDWANYPRSNNNPRFLPPGQYRAFLQPPAPQVPAEERWLWAGTGRRMAIITNANIPPSNEWIMNERDLVILGSYNWIRAPLPSIYVPGAPPKLIRNSLPFTVPNDLSIPRLPANQLQPPLYPHEPAFRCMDVMTPGVKFDTVDVVAPRHVLYQLFEFCADRAPSPFRINLFVVHDTIILERVEPDAETTTQGPRSTGWAKGFEEAVTEDEAGMDGSMGHHRVLRYDMGPLTLVVTCKVDAYLPPEASSSSSSASSLPSHHSSPHGSSTDEGDARSWTDPRTGSSSVSPAYSIANYHPNLRVTARGVETPHYQTAIVKAAPRFVPPSLCYPALWFGRSHHLVQGTLVADNVEAVLVSEVRDNLVHWERRPGNQGPLRRLVGLLRQLRALVRTSPAKACVAVCQGGNRYPLELEIFPADGREAALPDDLLERFWDGTNRQRR